MKVYLSEHIAPSALARLRAAFEVTDRLDHPEELDAMIVRRVPVPRALIEKAVRLKVISMHGVSRDLIDTAAAQERGIPVPNVPGESAESVAELAVSFMLALSRQLKLVDKGLRQGRFQHFGAPEFVTREVFGKTVGLVGTGHIARRVGAIMSGGFGARLLCYNPHKTAAACAAMGFEQVQTLEALFARSDFVSVCVTLSAETRGMIGAGVFAAANPNLILVNTARGGIVDEAALCEALTAGRIRAAASDVFVREPPAPDAPLLQLDNFIATFHIGGSTEEALERVSNAAVDHVFAYTGVTPPAALR